jgi:hypothetical protein
VPRKVRPAVHDRASALAFPDQSHPSVGCIIKRAARPLHDPLWGCSAEALQRGGVRLLRLDSVAERAEWVGAYSVKPIAVTACTMRKTSAETSIPRSGSAA